MRTLSIGDMVTTPSGQTGILKWTGRVNGKPIEYAGIELTSGQGLHSGEHEGHKYFETSIPGSGIFVSYSKLVSANSTTPLSRLGNSRLPALSSPARSSSRAASPLSPRREQKWDRNGSVGDLSELKNLRALLEEKDIKIKDLKASKELQRTEFRLHIQSIEADRNQIAEQYETMLRDASVANPHELAEIEVQKTALAAMQNKLMEENEQMRQSLEIAQREADQARNAARGPPNGSETSDSAALDSLLAELTQQEARLAELQESVQELDKLRLENDRLKRQNTELEQRAAEMEAQIDEVVALKDSLEELCQAPPIPAASAPADDEKHHAEVADLKEKLEAQKKRANKYAQEADEARKEAQTYFKMTLNAPDEARLKELQDQLETLNLKLKEKSTTAATPAATAPSQGTANTTAKSTPKTPAVVPDSTSISERELEDQILRDAGLLDPPSNASAPAPPVAELDPAAGRDMWCGLCEKSGHTTVDCPYD